MIDLAISRKCFNDIYYPYLKDYKNRLEVYYGGAGSGKSYFIICKILIKLLSSKRVCLIIRKTQVSQKYSCWSLCLSVLEKWKLKRYCDIKVSDYSIKLPNGSRLLFKGLDDPEKIKSIVDITDIWCEEATELTEDDFDQLNLRLRSNTENCQVFVSFNPVSKANWVYKRWFVNEVDNNTLIVKSTYKDNRFLPQDYIEQLEGMINTNPTYYRIYALGEFCSLDRLVYHNWKIEDFEDKKNLDIIIGLDFGFVNDPTALVASYIDTKEKKLYIFKEWVATGKTNTEIAGAIKNLGFSKSVIIADSAEPKSIEELKREGIVRIKSSRKGQDSIITGIKNLSEYQIYIKPSLTEIITEFENYSWSKNKDGEYLEKPIDEFNHCLDALRYSLQCITNKVQFLDKNKLGL